MIKLHVSVVIEREGRVLLLQEADEDYGLWNLPGGHVEATETIREGAVRETREETGLTVELTGFIGVYTGPPGQARTSLRFVYAATVAAESDPEVCGDDVLALRWVSREEFAAMDASKLLSPMRLRRILADAASGQRFPDATVIEA
jgi:8-oxo-dGTP pyrophosphatase MutT (NUDIX family)